MVQWAALLMETGERAAHEIGVMRLGWAQPGLALVPLVDLCALGLVHPAKTAVGHGLSDSRS